MNPFCAPANPSIVTGPVRIGVIAGTGLQKLPDFVEKATLNIDTPWGQPSSPITVLLHALKDGSTPHKIAFLDRHGVHHEFAPHEVNSRANIAALRSIGVRTIIAFSAVGSLQEEIQPRDFFIPDQIIDRTKGIRPFTFFETGVVGHVMFGDPFDEKLAQIVRKCGHSLEGDGVRLHDKGTLVCMGMEPFRLNAEMLTKGRGTPIQHTRRKSFIPLLGWKCHQYVCSS